MKSDVYFDVFACDPFMQKVRGPTWRQRAMIALATYWFLIVAIGAAKEATLGSNDNSEPVLLLQHGVAPVVIVAIVFLQLINIVLVYCQWTYMTDFVERLSDNRVVRLVPVEREHVLRAVHRMNRWFGCVSYRYRLGTVVWLLVSLVLVCLLFYGRISVSVIVSDYSSRNIPSLLWVLILTVAAIAFCYYLLLQNFVGVAFVRFFWSQWRRFEYRAERFSPDGAFGWQPLLNVLRTVHLSLLANSLSLVILYFHLWHEGSEALVLLMAILVVSTALYVVTPHVILNSGLERFRREECEKVLHRINLSDLHRQDDEIGWLDGRRALREELVAIRSIRPSPLLKEIGAVVLGALPVVIAVIEQVR